MAGRPLNPSWSVPVFAPDANYPLGALPWEGLPTKVPWAGASSVGFTPKRNVPAQALNWLFNQAFAVHSDAKDAVGHALDFLGQAPAMAFRSSVSVMVNTSVVKFCPGTLEWLGGGSTSISGLGSIVRTKDLRVWPTSNEIVSTLASFDGAFDVDPSGHIVMPGTGGTDGAKINDYNGSTWTVRSGLFSPAFLAPDVVYEPSSGRWCVAGRKNGVLALGVYTSSDRAAWTSRTAPTVANDGVGGPYCRLATDGAGVIVMQACKSSYPGAFTSDTISFSRSTDGGITWSVADAHAITWGASGANAPLPRPVWTGSKWVAVACNLTSKETYVYNSSDGATFSQVAHLTACAVQNVAAIGELVVGFAEDKNGTYGRIVFSVDQGATWHYSDECVPGLTSNLACVQATPSRFVLVDAAGGKLYFGAGVGMGAAVVT